MKKTRQEWLAKFIELCETNAPTTEYRRHCRIKAQQLPRHVRRLEEYRAELKALQVQYVVQSPAFKESDAVVPDEAILIAPEFEITAEIIRKLGELPKPPDDEYPLDGITELLDSGDSHGEDTEEVSEEADRAEEAVERPSDLRLEERASEGFDNHDDSGEAVIEEA